MTCKESVCRPSAFPILLQSVQPRAGPHAMTLTPLSHGVTPWLMILGFICPLWSHSCGHLLMTRVLCFLAVTPSFTIPFMQDGPGLSPALPAVSSFT